MYFFLNPEIHNISHENEFILSSLLWGQVLRKLSWANGSPSPCQSCESNTLSLIITPRFSHQSPCVFVRLWFSPKPATKTATGQGTAGEFGRSAQLDFNLRNLIKFGI